MRRRMGYCPMTEAMLARQAAMLTQALGALVVQALATPGTVEVMVNPDGTVWQERYGQAATCIGLQDARQTEAVIRLVAALNQAVVHAGQPTLAGTLPGGQRFQGFLPPRSKAPAFCIRIPPTHVLTREDYVPACCGPVVWEAMTQAVRAGDTILIGGGMGSGKTALLNALLAYMPPQVRTVTMEDTAELIVGVPNHLQLYSSHDDLERVVRDGFRTAGQRIPVGEIRDGKTARQALNLWLAVGGGLATTHADSARDALTRLAYLCADGSAQAYDALLGDVIDLVVYMATVAGHRRIVEVLRVTWEEGRYGFATVLDDAGPGRAVGAPGPGGRG